MEPVDIQSMFVNNSNLTPEDIQTILRAASGPQASEFEQIVRDLHAEASQTGDERKAARAGIGLFFLGKPQSAVEVLEGNSDPAARFYRAQALSTVGRHEESAAEFEDASKKGYDAIACTLRRAGELRHLGNFSEAETVVRSTGGEGARRAEYSYQMGCILSDRGDAFGAIEYFERAVDMDPHHSRALFCLAAQNSLHGNDDEAIQLYERALSKPPYYIGAMLNLGLLYEDRENYPAAEYCFRQVLRFDPSNERALLFLKDIEATGDMYYDEETLKNQAKMDQLLARPMSDFELSVRSRNCLASMDINTLGDMTTVSEQDLLAGKNFGETSLTEIRELMSAHGLSIGQNLHQKSHSEPDYSPQDLSPAEQAALSRPITDLNLSVRSRKCMTRLAITQIGQLTSRTPDELLSAKNFGVTSLNEIRQKLAEMGLKLRND
ncbi:MAG: tetratricopeptide repeat protein [Planctomycetaceae bacterium]|nr:tetratricopeptide repeat protein [Planctomycetaceae bacterium]